MSRKPLPLLAVSALLLAACAAPEPRPKEPLGYLPEATTKAEPEWIPFRVRAGKAVEADPRERHLAELRQLTFGGENAEAYFSPDGRRLVFQSTRDGTACDQIYVMELDTGATRRVSSGLGKTTCSYFFFPHGERVLYASTMAKGPGCPPKPDRAQGYVWPLDDYDIYSSKPDGTDLRPLIQGPGYDAEATVAFDGSRMVFTSARDGDLELYSAKLDGSDLRRLTSAPGYDGGAVYSPNGARLVWRASRPTGEALADYRALLDKGLVRPSALEIIVAGAEGQNARAVTANGKANFAPTFFPDSRRILFASDLEASPQRGAPPNFDLVAVDPEGPVTATGTPALERITYYEGFDAFPMFSPVGDLVVFASNRYGSQPGETNLFIARWVE